MCICVYVHRNLKLTAIGVTEGDRLVLRLRDLKIWMWILGKLALCLLGKPFMVIWLSGGLTPSLPPRVSVTVTT